MEFASDTSVSGSSEALFRSRVLGVIPARLSSSRLPRKPLHPILGRPLVEWVWERASGMSCLDAVVVATDSEEIANRCEAFGATAVLTSPDHPSGTDRVAEVARMEAFTGYGIVANVQGDEPLLAHDNVAAAVELVRDEGWDIATCATPVREVGELDDPAAVKVVRGLDGSALYFSRAEVPFARDRAAREEGVRRGRWLRHVGLYVYRREALLGWVERSPSELEKIEKLEQLRPLEAGARIGVALVEHAEAGVDTPEDVRRIEARLTTAGHTLNVETPTR